MLFYLFNFKVWHEHSHKNLFPVYRILVPDHERIDRRVCHFICLGKAWRKKLIN